MSAALTLYQIETELLELLQLRDEVVDEVRVTGDEDARNGELYIIDQQIAEYVGRELVKVDNIAGLIRECHQRAETLWMEEKRIAILRKRWQAREERVKSGAAEVMAMQVPPEEIVAANQGKVLRRLMGKSSELKLCKSPPSVEVATVSCGPCLGRGVQGDVVCKLCGGSGIRPDVSLIPEELLRITVSMPVAAWLAIVRQATFPTQYKYEEKPVEPDKRAIGAVLKSSVACEKCGGDGINKDQNIQPNVSCAHCGGSGSVPGSVPGCRLVEDSVHVRIA